MKSRSARHRAGGSALWLTALLFGAGLAGCNPIEGYRQISGFNKNDPDPATAPFTDNLESAEHNGYGNLASVPPPPIVSTTAAERAKIAQGLNAQRTSTEAPDTLGHPGSAAPGPVPPPPPIPPEIAAANISTTPPPPPQTPPPTRAANEPPVPGPLNSTLLTPTPSSPLPGVEANRSAPPQGSMPAMPQPAPSQLPPAVAQSVAPQPAPPVATLPEAKPSPQAAAMPPPKLPPVPVTLASLDVTPGATELSAAAQARVDQVVAQYNQKPGIVRIVAYAAAAVGGAEQLNSFRAALDRAEIVAKALHAAGIPAKQMQNQAAPSTPSAPVGRVEVQLLPAPPGGQG